MGYGDWLDHWNIVMEVCLKFKLLVWDGRIWFAPFQSEIKTWNGERERLHFVKCTALIGPAHFEWLVARDLDDRTKFLLTIGDQMPMGKVGDD